MLLFRLDNSWQEDYLHSMRVTKTTKDLLRSTIIGKTAEVGLRQNDPANRAARFDNEKSTAPSTGVP
jgi:hypothetical protein